MAARYQKLGYNMEHIPVSYDQIHKQILNGDKEYDHRSTLTQPVVNPILYGVPRDVPPPTNKQKSRPPFIHPVVTQYASLNKYH